MTTVAAPLDAPRLIRWIDASQVTLIHCVPSLFRAIITGGPRSDQFGSLRYVLMAGEQLFPADVDRWMSIFGDRIQQSSVVEKLYADHRLGKKGGKGLYRYEHGKRKGPDASVYALVGVAAPHPVEAKDAVDRMVLAMVNEAAVILEEKIAGSAEELDLAMIMGTGFPPFRGGLLRYADTLGSQFIVNRLDDLAARFGPRFTASPAMRRLAANDEKFYATYPRG